MMTNYLLFAVGLLVFAGFGWSGLAGTLTAILLAYLAGRWSSRYAWAIPMGAALIAGALLAVRLLPAAQISIAAPLGFSYLTLRLIAYLVDVKQGKYPAECSLFRFMLCMTYLPAAFLGPIERYDSIRAALFESRHADRDDFSCGAARILWGLFKKLCIAARAAVVVGTISSDPEQYRGIYAFFAMLTYSLQLYADFSGGMDIVLGASQMLGVRLSENFRTPFFSETVQEFWRRWHITLGSWLKDYIYIPLGGSRRGRCRRVLHLLAAFAVSGLWHGTDYLLWGLLNGVLVAAGDRLKTGSRLLNQMVTFLLVSLLWAFFIWPDAGTALTMICSLFSGIHAVTSAGLGLELGEWIVMVGSAVVLWLYDRKADSWKDWFLRRTPAGRAAAVCSLVLTVLIFGMYGIGFQVDAFVYSRF